MIIMDALIAKNKSKIHAPTSDSKLSHRLACLVSTLDCYSGDTSWLFCNTRDLQFLRFHRNAAKPDIEHIGTGC